jgi:hypothetical protein
MKEGKKWDPPNYIFIFIFNLKQIYINGQHYY